jgi:four helix bundle protein
MGSVESYRDLVAWQKAINLVVFVYDETRHLPADERYGLTSQMRKCAVSIASNIAEGWGRESTDDYVRFLRTARGSIFELLTQVEICTRLGSPGDWPGVHKVADELGRIMHGLIRAVRDSGA